MFETNNGTGSFKKLTPADQKYNQESYVRPADMDLDDIDEEPSDEEYESAPLSQDTPDEEQDGMSIQALYRFLGFVLTKSTLRKRRIGT